MTSPRKRNPENRGLPTRWALKHGAYYYLVWKGLKDLWDGKRWFRLGKTLPEAYRAWAERRQDDGAALRTVANLLDRNPIKGTGQPLAGATARPAGRGLVDH